MAIHHIWQERYKYSYHSVNLGLKAEQLANMLNIEMRILIFLMQSAAQIIKKKKKKHLLIVGFNIAFQIMMQVWTIIWLIFFYLIHAHVLIVVLIQIFTIINKTPKYFPSSLLKMLS